MSIIDAVLTPDQQTEITQYVNNYRAIHQAPPLTWDNTIALFSQNWAKHLITNNLFEHSGSVLYGENLAYFQGYGSDIMALMKKSIDMWYNEVALYDFNKPGFSGATGHFTALVWVASTSFGLGLAINMATDAADIVMNILPPGNIKGQYELNVLPALSPGPSPTPTPTATPRPTPSPTATPSPTSTPVPSPTATPVPSPTATPRPTPVTNIVTINQLINSLYMVVTAVQSNQPKFVVVSGIYNIISLINSVKITHQQHLTNLLFNVIFLIQRRQPKATIIGAISNIISELNYEIIS